MADIYLNPAKLGFSSSKKVAAGYQLVYKNVDTNFEIERLLES